MASNPAVDEFNSLMSRNAPPRASHHPGDDDTTSDVLSDTTTLAASYKSKPSLRSSTQSGNSRRTVAARSARPTSTSSFYNHDSSDSDGENSAPAAAHLRKPSKYYLPSTYDRDAMTGPKGVIADAAAFEKEKRGKRSSDFKRTMELALPRAQSYGGSSSGPNSRKGSASDAVDENPDEDDEDRAARTTDDDDDDDDDEALRRWRERRFDELRDKAAGARRGGSSRRDPHHGTLENVSPHQFLAAVETAGRGATVVVYIFDDSAISDAYTTPVATLAHQHPAVHFVALHHLDAEIERAGVPALLAYRNGELFADLMPLADEVPLGRDTAAALERRMRERGMLL